MEAPVDATIADVLVDPLDPTLPYIDVVLGNARPGNQVWVDRVEQGIRIEVEIDRVKRQFPREGPGTPAYGPVAEFLHAAEELSALAEPFRRMILAFVSDINPSPSSMGPEGGRATVSHVNIDGGLQAHQVDIVLSSMGSHGGILTIGQEASGIPRLQETGGMNRSFKAGEHSEALLNILGDGRRFHSDATAFAKMIAKFLSRPDDASRTRP